MIIDVLIATPSCVCSRKNVLVLQFFLANRSPTFFTVTLRGFRRSGHAALCPRPPGFQRDPGGGATATGGSVEGAGFAENAGGVGRGRLGEPVETGFFVLGYWLKKIQMM